MVRPVHRATWEFGGFELIPEQRLLLGDGVPVPLTSKAFDTLLFLVENRDRVVTKDEILRVVWPDVIVEEGNLTQQIFLIRKALGESAQQPRYVVTIPGHGYRFIAPVNTGLPSARAYTVVTPDSVTTEGGVQSRTQHTIRVGLLMGAVVALAGVLLAVRGIVLPNRRPWLDPATVRITKVTETGKAINGVISPDGRFTAYAQGDGDEYSLWLQRIATGGNTQVVPRQPETLTDLAFSPDGEFIYFTRGTLNRGGFVLHRVPAIGGQETPVLDDVDSPISFSPDGRQFVFMRGAGRETRIVVAHSDSSTQRILASRTAPLTFSFAAPSWSPDGRMVAATATDQSTGKSSIVLLPVDGGSSRDLYASDSRIGAVRWLPDGSGLLTVISETLARQFAAWQSGAYVHLSGGPIWRIGYPSGKAERLTTDLAEYDLCCLSIAADGRTISGVVNSLVSDLWMARAGELGAPRQVTWGNPVVTRHAWLPDNDTIVYRDLSGRLSAVRKDGRAFNLQLPEAQKVGAGGVSACGDGRYIVFQGVPGRNIWRVTPNAGGATQLTHGFVDSNPACSPDGKWVLFSSMRNGIASTWRVPIEGGEPSPLIPGQSFDPLPSPIGRLIQYSAFEWEERPVRLRRLRWIVISSTDRERLFTFEMPDDAALPFVKGWAPDESGLDYVVTRNGVSNIWRQPLAGGRPVQITNFSSGKIFGFAWSPDGHWLSLASGVNRSDVVLISREP